jgi:hypothetical protein
LLALNSPGAMAARSAALVKDALRAAFIFFLLRHEFHCGRAR